MGLNTVLAVRHRKLFHSLLEEKRKISEGSKNTSIKPICGLR